MQLPFLHPALLGVGVAGAIAWAALAPARLRGPWWCAGAGTLAAAIAGLAGLVPWTGHLLVTAYAACMLVAFALAWWIARRRAVAAGIDGDFVRVQLALAAVAGVLGARLWYVVEYRREFPDPLADPAGWLTTAADLDRGGAVWFGGLLLAGLVLVLHARRAGTAVVLWADCAAPAVLAGLAVGRIGCLLNGCCYGGPCSLPWAVIRDGVPVHPTQLYESIACAVLAAVIVCVRPAHGAAAGWAMLGYAAWRFLNETMRGDYAVKLGQGFSLWPPHLTSAQWFALILAAGGAWLILRARRRTHGG
jgi:phosphatidylglycerol:prolipoprotein diacylglycerol transferase